MYWHPTLKMWFLTRYADIQLIARDPRFTATRAEHFGQGAPARALRSFIHQVVDQQLDAVRPHGKMAFPI